MTPLLFTLAVFGLSIVAGLLGALLGLGGGFIVVPALTLLLGVDIHTAIAASIVSVIATSSGAAAAFVRDGLSNLRVAMVLEVGTAAGAIGGALLGGALAPRWLFLTFGVVMGWSAYQVYRGKHHDETAPVRPDPLAERLRLHGSYHDHHEGRDVAYQVTGVLPGAAIMVGAGVISGLLGIGAGALKVLALDLVMKLPIKVSTATSNFMMGVTAAVSAGILFARGDVDPFVAAPVAAGVLLGAVVGGRLLVRTRSQTIRRAFVVVVVALALQMLWRGLG